jgi:hypothetical protein
MSSKVSRVEFSWRRRTARKPTALRIPPRFEALEDRTLLSSQSIDHLPIDLLAPGNNQSTTPPATVKVIQSDTVNSAASGATWTTIGPAPIVNGQIAHSDAAHGAVSGRVTAVAPDKTDPNTLFIAAAGGGVWKTTNATNPPASGGPSWSPLTDNLTTSGGTPIPLFMGALAETRDASNNEIVYAGTGEANNSGDSFYGEGILVSKDGGTTWTLTTAGGAFTRQTVSKIAIDPSDSTGATAYAAVAGFGSNGVDNGNCGIWKTTNFGATWTNITSGLANSPTFNEWSDVVIDPKTPSTVYAAEGSYFTGNGWGTGNGIYKSTNSGANWSQLTGTGSFNGTQDGRITLAVFDNGTTQELLASIATPVSSTGSSLYKMLKSTDGGNTFITLTVPNYLGSQGWYDTTLITSPTNANYIYAGGAMSSQGPTFSGAPIESFDGGATWVDIGTDAAGNGPHSDFHGVGFDAAGNIIDGDDGGVFRLNNPTNQSTQSWSDLNTNLNTIQFAGIAVDPTTSTVAYGGSQDNGTEKYTGSLGWQLIFGGDGGITRLDPTNHLRLYREYVDVSITRSDDGGATFTDITSGIKANTVNFYAPYVLDSSGDILFGSDYVNLSTNQGGTWSQIGTPGVNTFNLTDKPIDAIAVSPVNKAVVWVSAGGKMFVTQNATAAPGSVTWTEHDLPSGAVAARNSIAFDPTDASGGTAYAVVNAFTGSSANHIFKTTNFGATWTDISGNLFDSPVNSIAVSPDGKTIYIGNDVGVYTASNTGPPWTWTRFGAGLPNAQVVELEVVPSLNILAAGTHGRGMWEISTQASVATTTTLASSVNPSVFGQSVTFTATVAPVTGTNTPGGTVTFKDGATTLGTGTLNGVSGNDQATFTTSALTVGSHVITAVYGGDPNDNGSTGTLSGGQTVNQDATTTAVGSSANPSVLGQAVTFTATVSVNSPGAGTPSSTVTFKDGATTLGTGTLNGVSGNDQATFTTSALTVGSHVITAVYGGDPNDNGSTGTLSGGQTVDQAPAITSTNSATFTVGSVGSFTVTTTAFPIASLSETGTLPSGMTFADKGDGTATLSGNPAAGTGGTYSLTFTASNNVGNDATQTFTLTVYEAPTIKLNPTNQTVAAGAMATFTAAANGFPVPTVQWMVSTGGNTFSPIAGATSATYSFTATTAQSGYEYEAVFSNSSGTITTSAATLTVLTTAATTTTVTALPSSSVFGQAVTFTATVAAIPPATGTPTGSVTFMDLFGNTTLTLGTATLNTSGTATLPSKALPVGSDKITAMYSGDSKFDSSTSAAWTQTVNQDGTTATIVASPNPSVFGQRLTMTITIKAAAPGGGVPTGNVTIFDGSTSLGTVSLNSGGKETFSTRKLGVGTHSITASYAGDSDFSGSTTAALTQIVSQADTKTTLTSSASTSRFGQPVTFTAIVKAVAPGSGVPTGTVTFYDGTTSLGSVRLNDGSGQVKITIGTFSVGTHTITASYSGDGNFTPSTSAALTQNVNQAATKTTIVSSPNSSSPGQFTFTAKVASVTPGIGIPTGTVTFTISAPDGTTLSSGTFQLTVVKGVDEAMFKYAFSAPGTYTIEADYNGDPNFAASSSLFRQKIKSLS